MSAECIFVHEGTSEGDVALFLDGFSVDHPLVRDDPRRFSHLIGPTDRETIRRFGNGVKLAHLMYDAGLFPSVSEARRNGWDKDIPDGFSQFRVGKRRILVTILKT